MAAAGTLISTIQAFGTAALAGATVAGTLVAVFAPVLAALAAGPIIRKIAMTVSAEFQRHPDLTPDMRRGVIVNWGVTSSGTGFSRTSCRNGAGQL